MDRAQSVAREIALLARLVKLVNKEADRWKTIATDSMQYSEERGTLLKQNNELKKQVDHLYRKLNKKKKKAKTSNNSKFDIANDMPEVDVKPPENPYPSIVRPAVPSNDASTHSSSTAHRPPKPGLFSHGGWPFAKSKKPKKDEAENTRPRTVGVIQLKAKNQDEGTQNRTVGVIKLKKKTEGQPSPSMPLTPRPCSRTPRTSCGVIEKTTSTTSTSSMSCSRPSRRQIMRPGSAFNSRASKSVNKLNIELDPSAGCLSTDPSAGCLSTIAERAQPAPLKLDLSGFSFNGSQSQNDNNTTQAALTERPTTSGQKLRAGSPNRPVSSRSSTRRPKINSCFAVVAEDFQFAEPGPQGSEREKSSDGLVIGQKKKSKLRRTGFGSVWTMARKKSKNLYFPEADQARPSSQRSKSATESLNPKPPSFGPAPPKSRPFRTRLYNATRKIAPTKKPAATTSGTSGASLGNRITPMLSIEQTTKG